MKERKCKGTKINPQKNPQVIERKTKARARRKIKPR
jgi:hypothetical protein